MAHRVFMRKLFFLLLVLGALPGAAQYNVVLEIDTIPHFTPMDSIFVAGTVNGWNPQSKDHQVIPPPDGPLQMLINAPAGLLSFKFTRGSWNSVETSAKGGDIENRTIDVRGDTLVHVSIRGWKDRFVRKAKPRTALPTVRVLRDSLWMPQLERSRRVWVCLPKDYYQSKKRYPVLYLQDAQNLFDDSVTAFGEWGIDEAMDSLERSVGGIIIVAIEHGGNKRINEYSPYDMERFGKGEGRAYTDFLVQTLKPLVDRTLRTRRDRSNTFIAGSSMGGLISLYAHLRYPQVFGASGVFSPAFWVAPDIRKDVLRQGNSLTGKVFFYAGEAESETMVPDMLTIFNLLHQLSKAKMETVIRADARHTEAAWRKEFPGFIRFIMKKEPKPFTPRF
ncbi:MAG: alpha/beta hydrolase [Chitinophagaceae bacterium]|nr:MAG: alpha/beta hydrolase [Chitinophagaceae bacterium]